MLWVYWFRNNWLSKCILKKQQKIVCTDFSCTQRKWEEENNQDFSVYNCGVILLNADTSKKTKQKNKKYEKTVNMPVCHM